MIAAAEERALRMRERAHGWRKGGRIDEATERAIVERFPTSWRGSSLLGQIVAFGLTAVAVALFGAFWQLISDSTLIAGVAALLLGEYAVRRLHWWSTGVEAALWVGGLFALIVALPGEGSVEALLLFAAASLVGMIRLRQPWFAALAVLFVFVYLAVKDLHIVALVSGIGLGLAALLLLHKTWIRPSSEWLLIAVLLVAPPAGFFASEQPFPRLAMAALFLVLAIVFLAAGIRLRHHVPLVAAGIALLIVAGQTEHLLRIVTEAKLALAGALLLGSAAILSRALRGRTSGFVATPPPRTETDALLDLSAVVVATPEPAETTSDDRPQGDGGFGGAGATGSF